MSDITPDLPVIDHASLTPMVRTALGLPDAQVTAWRHETFGHSLDDVYGNARSIFRVAGAAHDRGRDLPWTMVLKIVRTPGTPDDPTSPDNGDREPLAYRSGFLEHVPGVRAPRCYAVIDRPAGGHWLWLEDIAEGIGRDWPLERYMLAARHLAQFNAGADAATLTALHPWLSRSPLREVVADTAPGVARIRDAADNPYVAQAISPEAAAALLELLDHADRWLDLLDQLPQTICHWDAHRANLLSRTTGEGVIETVAIDWAGVGVGPIGSEISKLLSQTVNFFGLKVDALPGLDAQLFEHYMAGLTESGWHGDPRIVRFGYTAAASMRLIVRTSMALNFALSERARAGFERAAGVPFAKLAENFKGALPYYLSLVDEADRLAKTI